MSVMATDWFVLGWLFKFDSQFNTNFLFVRQVVISFGT